jgi:trehalose 6-phosphate phosphatase
VGRTPTASSSSGAEIAADPARADAVRALLAEPARTALVMDFDGTLAEIVPHPDDAVARPEVAPLLHALVARFGLVGIVSGRPVDFLRARVPVPGLELVGQYGLERSVDGRIEADPRAEPFVAAVAAAADRADAELPGVFVERKGRLAVTLHWRTGQDLAEAGRAWADRVAAEHGLTVYPTRMAVELRPPVGIDKGDALRSLVRDARTAMFAGDDHGDLAAFDALAQLRRDGALDAAVRVAVRSPEEPAELLARADVAVDGPAGVVGLLRALVEGAPAGA